MTSRSFINHSHIMPAAGVVGGGAGSIQHDLDRAATFVCKRFGGDRLARGMLAVRQPAKPSSARRWDTTSRSVARRTCGSGYYESKHFIVDLKPKITDE